jgi:hypothetical protein
MRHLPGAGAARAAGGQCDGRATRETERDVIGNLANEQFLNPQARCGDRVFCL